MRMPSNPVGRQDFPACDGIGLPKTGAERNNLDAFHRIPQGRKEQTMTDQPSPSILQPLAKAERIEALDILRGFALFGVFAVNIAGFAAPTWVPGYIPPSWTGIDAAAAFFTETFLSLKFFTLFSFLFGAGFAVQMGRAEASGRDFMSFYPRRLFALFCFGLLHHVLAWEGDILKLYALMGFALLLFRKTGDRGILAAAVLAWFLGSAGYVFAEVFMNQGQVIDFDTYLAANRAAYRDGGFIAACRFRLWDLAHTSGELALSQGGIAFSMFLTGLYVGRKGFLARLDRLPGLPRLVWLSGIAGLALTALYMALPRGLPSTIAAAFTNAALTAFYASAVLLAASAPSRARFLAPLAAGGRMALTNYVLQSVLASLAFFGYGAGLYERLGPGAWLGFVIVTYAAQLAASGWWLSRFRFGPLEWVWRGLTYGSLPPFRR